MYIYEWLTPNFICAQLQALAFYRRPWFLWPLTAKESRPVDFTVNTHNSASWFALTSLYEPSLLERFHQDQLQDHDDEQESQYTGGCVLCEEHQFLLDEDAYMSTSIAMTTDMIMSQISASQHVRLA